MYEAVKGRDEMKEARYTAIAESIVESLTDNNLTVAEASEVMYKAEEILRSKSQRQALSDLVKNITSKE